MTTFRPISQKKGLKQNLLLFLWSIITASIVICWVCQNSSGQAPASHHTDPGSTIQLPCMIMLDTQGGYSPSTTHLRQPITISPMLYIHLSFGAEKMGQYEATVWRKQLLPHSAIKKYYSNNGTTCRATMSVSMMVRQNWGRLSTGTLFTKVS